MITLCFSGKSRISAEKIVEASGGRIRLNRGPTGDINWGRSTANTELNPAIGNSTNKREMRILFGDNEVPAPEYISANVAAGLLEGYDQFPIVGRPDHHSKGRGYWLCNNHRDVVKALRGTRRKAAATHFLQYIEAEHELRVHIFNGKSIRISEKQHEYIYRPNGTLNVRETGYTTIKPTVPRKRVRNAAKKAMEAIGLDVGAVDVLVDADKNVYVLEVNASPGLGGTLPELYAKTFIEFMEEA